MSVIKLEEIRLLKQSEKSMVLLVREMDGEQLFVQKTLQGRHEIYETLQNNPHPYLPKIHEVTVSDDVTVVLEEHIDGQTLDSAALTEKQICAAVKELCTVLGFLHEKGIVHRDVKPSNIIMANDNHIRLIDFDAARMVKDNLEQDTKLLGTRGYAPPEQFGFSQTDARTDIYSLGVTIEQLLGKRAKKPKYKRIIRKCTDLNPDKRYQSARAVKNTFSIRRCSFAYISITILLAIVSCYFLYRPLQAEDERLLFYAEKSEYIIEDLDEVLYNGKTATMQVDLHGNGEPLDFTIAVSPDNIFLQETFAQTVDGDKVMFWTSRAYTLLLNIPSVYDLVFDDDPFLIQITCVDIDGDGVKEVLVSQGIINNCVVTEVWQAVNQDGLELAGIMWGNGAMHLREKGNIFAEVYEEFPSNHYNYTAGTLIPLSTTDLSVYKEFADSVNQRNRVIPDPSMSNDFVLYEIDDAYILERADLVE